MYKDFEEFNKNIRPYYGPGNLSKNMELFKFIEEDDDDLGDD